MSLCSRGLSVASLTLLLGVEACSCYPSHCFSVLRCALPAVRAGRRATIAASPTGRAGSCQSTAHSCVRRGKSQHNTGASWLLSRNSEIISSGPADTVPTGPASHDMMSTSKVLPSWNCTGMYLRVPRKIKAAWYQRIGPGGDSLLVTSK